MKSVLYACDWRFSIRPDPAGYWYEPARPGSVHLTGRVLTPTFVGPLSEGYLSSDTPVVSIYGAEASSYFVTWCNFFQIMVNSALTHAMVPR